MSNIKIPITSSGEYTIVKLSYTSSLHQSINSNYSVSSSYAIYSETSSYVKNNPQQSCKFSVESLKDLKTEDGNIKKEIFVRDMDRGGWFVFQTRNFPHWVSNTHGDGWMYEDDASGTGKWLRKWDNGTVNIKWAGAVGDGNTECTTEIQKAFDFAESGPDSGYSLNGKVFSVYVPTGMYLINGTIQVGPYARDRIKAITVVGDGKEHSTFFTKNGEEKPMFYIETTSAVEFRDVSFFSKIVYNRGDTVGYNGPIAIWRNDGMYFTDNRLLFSGFSRAYVIDNNVNGNYGTIRDCEFYHCGCAINTFSGATMRYENLRIMHCGTGVVSKGNAGITLNVQTLEGVGGAFDKTAGCLRFSNATGFDAVISYTEGNHGKLLSLGEVLSFNGNATIDENNIVKMNVEGFHLFRNGQTVEITSNSTDPSIIAYICGKRKLVGPPKSAGYVLFETGGTVTSSLDDVSFVISETHTGKDDVLVRNFNIRGLFLNSGKEHVISLDNARNGDIWMTSNSRTRLGDGIGVNFGKNVEDVNLHITGDGYWIENDDELDPPVNIFPDPEFENYLNGFSSDFYRRRFEVEWDKNISRGRGGSIKFTPEIVNYHSNVCYAYATLNVDAPVENRDLYITFRTLCPNMESYRPEEISIENSGSGYVNGVAQLILGNKVVYINITTDENTGGITSAKWISGHSGDQNDTQSVDVIQETGVGGKINVDNYSVSGWGTRTLPSQIAYYTVRLLDQNNNTIGIIDNGSRESLRVCKSWRRQGGRVSCGPDVTSIKLQLSVVGADGYIDGSEVVYLDDLVIVDVNDGLSHKRSKMLDMAISEPNKLYKHDRLIDDTKINEIIPLEIGKNNNIQIIKSNNDVSGNDPLFVFLSNKNASAGDYFHIVNENMYTLVNVKDENNNTLKTMRGKCWAKFHWHQDNKQWKLVEYGIL